MYYDQTIECVQNSLFLLLFSDQVILQLLFIQDIARRRISSADQVQFRLLEMGHFVSLSLIIQPQVYLIKLCYQDRSKPGRQIVTFLLICNLSIWVIYTFEVQKVEESPVQVALQKLQGDQICYFNFSGIFSCTG